MAEKASKWVQLKRLMKRNMNPKWIRNTIYQCVSFVICVAMVIGVAEYAITKSYDERELTFVENFTITAHTGAYNTQMNSIDSVKAAIDNKAQVLEVDVRLRPDGTVVMSHDIVVTNKDGALMEEALELLQDKDIMINFDIKETKALDNLYDLIIKYNLLSQSFLTGIEASDIKAVKASKCANMDYFLNCKPSRIKIFSDDYKKKLIDQLEETGAVGVNCNYSFAGSQLSNLLHKNGYKLSVWTIDSTRIMKKMLVIKPDNITTKNPPLIQDVIDNWGK